MASPAQRAPVHPIPSTELVAIEFPGFIKNPDAALQTMGGLKTISDAYHSKKPLLRLNFRPANPYSRNIFGDRISTNNLLIEVEQAEDGTMGVQLLGKITTTYKFSGLADFQYVPELPTEELKEPKDQSDELPTYDDQTPIHLPMPLFAKKDKPAPLTFPNPALQAEQKATPNKPTSSQLIPVTIEAVPSEPQVTPEPEWQGCITFLQRLFEERPIYSRAAIIHNIPRDQLRYLKHSLPCVAYCFSNGPWRKMWVRIGYDPRKNPEARMYQVVDFRVRKDQTRGNKLSYWRRSKLSTPLRQRRNSLDVALIAEDDEMVVVEDDFDPAEYRFQAPPSNMVTFYQLVDIDDPEVHRIAESNASSTYSDQHGWLAPGTLKKIRSAMRKKLDTMLQSGTTVREEKDETRDEKDEESSDEMDISNEEEAEPPEAVSDEEAAPGDISDMVSLAQQISQLEGMPAELTAFQTLEGDDDDDDDYDLLNL